jgi:hypothetical protein
MIKRFIIRGVSKKFKGVQKLPAQKTPKFRPDPGEAAIKQFTKKFGDKPQFMGFSERAGVSMAAESLASKTAERSFIKTLMGSRKRVGSTASALGRSRTKTVVGVKSTLKPAKIKIFRAKQKGAMKAYGIASKKSDAVFTKTLEKFSGTTKRSPFKTVTKRVDKLSKAGHDSREFQYIKKVKDEWGF